MGPGCWSNSHPDSAPLKLILDSEDRKRTPLEDLVLLLVVLVPVIVGDILAVVGVPDRQEDDHVRTGEIEAPVHAQVQLAHQKHQ
jgi:hypothetical protein